MMVGHEKSNFYLDHARTACFGGSQVPCCKYLKQPSGETQVEKGWTSCQELALTCQSWEGVISEMDPLAPEKPLDDGNPT
jgi:hypothetical protein